MIDTFEPWRVRNSLWMVTNFPGEKIPFGCSENLYAPLHCDQCATDACRPRVLIIPTLSLRCHATWTFSHRGVDGLQLFLKPNSMWRQCGEQSPMSSLRCQTTTAFKHISCKTSCRFDSIRSQQRVKRTACSMHL